MYELLPIHRRNMCNLEELEKEQLKKSSSLEHMQMNNSRLKARMTELDSVCPAQNTNRLLSFSINCSNTLLTTRGHKRNILFCTQQIPSFLILPKINELLYYRNQTRTRLSIIFSSTMIFMQLSVLARLNIPLLSIPTSEDIKVIYITIV